MTLFIFLSLIAMGLLIGLASQEDPVVIADLSHTVRVYGKTYHPHSKGVKMPLSHAKALGIAPKTQPKKQPPKTETSDLPEDLDSRDTLIKAGLDTIEKVLGHNDLSEIKGIGKATKEKILVQLAPKGDQ